MKKFLAILAVLVLSMLAIVPLTVACADDDIITQYYVDTEDGKTVNLRSRPDGSLLTRLGVGKPVTLIEDLGNGWTKVSVKANGEKLNGYIMSEFLSPMDPTEEEQTFVKVNRFKVYVTPSKGEFGHINLRSEASADSTCLRYLHQGDELTVIAESHAWYQVRTVAGTTGYVVKGFVSKTEQ